MARERIIGVIRVLNRRGGPFTADDQRLLEALAGMGGVAIGNARLYEGLEEKVKERTAALTRTLAELRDTQAQLVQSEKMAALGDPAQAAAGNAAKSGPLLAVGTGHRRVQRQHRAGATPIR